MWIGVGVEDFKLDLAQPAGDVWLALWYADVDAPTFCVVRGRVGLAVRVVEGPGFGADNCGDEEVRLAYGDRY